MSESYRTKRFTINDLTKVRQVHSPKISPDGNHIVYGTSVQSLTENTRSDLITITSPDRTIKKTIAKGTAYCWSPSSLEIAYESEDGSLCIYHLLKRNTIRLAKIYHSSHFINHLEDKSPIWSPDGKYIAYLSAPIIKSNNKQDPGTRVFNRLLYKSKGGVGRTYYNDNRFTQIFIIPVSGGVPEMITEGPYNHHSISWSPDTSEIAFISNRSLNPDGNQLNDLWKINIETKEVTKLTESKGTAYQPKWSPHGNFIAYLATTGLINTNDSMAEDTHAFYLPSYGGTSICLTESLDRRVDNISWHPNAKYIYFTAENEGRLTLLKVFLDSKKIKAVLEDGDYSVHEYSMDFKVEKICYSRSDIQNPDEIFITQPDRCTKQQLTYENKNLIDEFELQNAKSFWFKSFDETPIHGWLMKPINFDAMKKYPLALVIHSGPHNMFGYKFEELMQLLAGCGYGVLFINPRGSSGYGQTFSNGNLMDWGGGDYKDLMNGLDYVINLNNWIDKQKLVVTGQSYGGYMTNWIITQTNRFKAAVVDGGISNLISFSGTSILSSLMESEFKGNIYNNYTALWRCSPLRCVDKVNTPTLFLHGETDNEVPISQAEEMYVALKKLGVKTTMVQYIGEGHGWRPNLTPKNRQDLYRRMINWFDLHISDD
ncbi:S9 family peptidase [Arenibacter sp. S6351L]|uniref:S9 family peptidase n=1 Tax=Arenibacter sp. S6351L TaxID=2926407 RepID=UPI001FF3BB45|nr:S9 family peptidase [Arenibacter sp. S6351L]MCK0135350.1 S9 family peptidase [Arenibacter sp. S6351L]